VLLLWLLVALVVVNIGIGLTGGIQGVQQTRHTTVYNMGVASILFALIWPPMGIIFGSMTIVMANDKEYTQ
jgi:hypothetical protein